VINRQDYHLFMSILIDRIANASEENFSERIEMMIKSSYEINCPEHGRVEVIDVTEEVIESMGGKWRVFSDAGVKQVCFLRFFLLDHLVLETGRLSGKVADAVVANETLMTLDAPVLRAFAKAMLSSMRRHGIEMLKEMLDGTFDPDNPDSSAGDDMGLATLIRQFMDEEVDEVVAKFSHQLDSVFTVRDIILPPPQEGGERHDLPAPPL
jgi:hypothetical protein